MKDEEILASENLNPIVTPLFFFTSGTKFDNILSNEIVAGNIIKFAIHFYNLKT